MHPLYSEGIKRFDFVVHNSLQWTIANGVSSGAPVPTEETGVYLQNALRAININYRVNVDNYYENAIEYQEEFIFLKLAKIFGIVKLKMIRRATLRLPTSFDSRLTEFELLSEKFLSFLKSKKTI